MSINRRTLQELSHERTRDAEVLLAARRPGAAYYLMGYAVECALKACVAKQVKEHDFPDRGLAQRAFTHDLDALVRVAGLEQDFGRHLRESRAFDRNWATVRTWSESMRYEPGMTMKEATVFCRACTGKPYGILTWIRERW